MRIAIATDAWHPQINGVVTTLSTLAKELVNLGHEVRTISPQGFKTIPCPTYAEIRLAVNPGRKLVRLLEEFRPEAIHVATEGPIGLAARSYCLKRKLQFTSSLHTRFPEYLRLRAPVPLSWGYAFLRWFHRPATHTMVAVPSLKKELEERGLRDPVIWSRGVDLELFRPRDRSYLSGLRPIFMYMGRVAVEKNITAFLDLDLPGTKFVVGGGPDVEELKDKYPAVCFTGYKTGEPLAQHLASADVLVFPSRTDTFGLVILEANACGVPVAAFPVQCPKDLIRNHENGATDDDLAQAALSCLTIDRDRCRQVAAGYSWQACAEQFLEHVVPVQRLSAAVV